MAAVLYLPDGTDEVILDKQKDYTNLIRKKLGNEVADYLDNYITELQKAADYTAQKVETDLNSYESSLYCNTNTFNEIYEDVDNLKLLITDSKRLNKDELYNGLCRLQEIIKNRE